MQIYILHKFFETTLDQPKIVITAVNFDIFRVMEIEDHSVLVNPFQVNVPFLFPLKTLDFLNFSVAIETEHCPETWFKGKF